MSSTQEDILRSKASFYRVTEFPLCIACVDGTQIEGQSFGGFYAELYRNGKSYFSMNCQIACAANVIHLINSYLIRKNL